MELAQWCVVPQSFLKNFKLRTEETMLSSLRGPSLLETRPDGRGLVGLKGASTYQAINSENFSNLMQPLMRHFKDQRNISALLVMKDGSEIRYCQITPQLGLWMPHRDYHTGASIDPNEFNANDVVKIRRVTTSATAINGIFTFCQKGDIDETCVGVEITAELAAKQLSAWQMFELLTEAQSTKDKLVESLETTIWVNDTQVISMGVVLKERDRFQIRFKIICQRDY
jgi:hypothetical protein